MCILFLERMRCASFWYYRLGLLVQKKERVILCNGNRFNSTNYVLLQGIISVTKVDKQKAHSILFHVVYDRFRYSKSPIVVVAAWS